MTQEEKQLLLKDICARLPYGLMYRYNRNANYPEDCNFNDFDSDLHSIMDYISEGAEYIKPYLRPMSSMTEEEREYLQHHVNDDFVDYCNEHYLDYRGLISMGLAVKAPKDMYKTE